VFEVDSFYHGILRLRWIFPSPNYLGAFIGSLIPCFWCLQLILPSNLPRWRYCCCYLFLLSIQGFLIYLLCRTYSRGSMVALCLTLFFFLTIVRAHIIERLRVAIICAIFIAAFGLKSQFSARLTPGFVRTDDAAQSRITTWMASAELFSERPLCGWGNWAFGDAYSNWIQPLDAAQEYRTPLNSFLKIACENGWITFCLILEASTLIVMAGAFPSSNVGYLTSCLYATASSIILNFLTCNNFSVLWIDWRVDVAPILATTVSLHSILKCRPPKFYLFALAAMTFGFAVSFGVFVTGMYSRKNKAIDFNFSRDPDRITVTPRNSSKGTILYIPDTAIIGSSYGKEARRLCEASGYSICTVQRQDCAAAIMVTQPKAIVALGRNCHDLAAGTVPVIYVHPTAPPPLISQPDTTILIVPGIDENGTKSLWLRWAHDRQILNIESAGVGNDIREQWPKVAVDALNKASL